MRLLLLLHSFMIANYEHLGVPENRQAYTINKVCSSGLKALISAAQSIQVGYRKCVLVVGTESMSNVPFYLARGDHGYGELKLTVCSLILRTRKTLLIGWNSTRRNF